MTLHFLRLSKNLAVEIRVEEHIVAVTTEYMGKERTTYYDCVKDAMDMTMLPAVHEYLKLEYATN
jgi:hypothetical protein